MRSRRYTTALRFAAGFPQTRFVLVSERYRPAMLTAVRTIRCKHQVPARTRPAHILGKVVNFDTQISHDTLGKRENP